MPKDKLTHVTDEDACVRAQNNASGQDPHGKVEGEGEMEGDSTRRGNNRG